MLMMCGADASGHGKGPDREFDSRRGGRERRGHHRGSRREHERERDRDRDRDLDQDGANQFASRFQSIEEVLGQVCPSSLRCACLSAL